MYKQLLGMLTAFNIMNLFTMKKNIFSVDRSHLIEAVINGKKK